VTWKSMWKEERMIFGILRDWHERKDADLIASSSDGKTDRPASRYVNFFNRSNERRENRK
jgi:hypothetical protein